MRNLILNNPKLSEVVLSDYPEFTIVYGADNDFQLMYYTSTGAVRWTTENERQHIQDMLTMLAWCNESA